MLAASCSDSTTEPDVCAPRAVSLLAYTAQPIATRADSALLADKIIPAGGSIGVYAYYHDNATWSTDAARHPSFMCNQQATNIGLDEPFSYAPLKYWPNEEADKVSFIAYYPYSGGTTAEINRLGVTPCLLPTGSGMPVFRFHVNDDVRSQVDLMLSDLVADMPRSRDTDADPAAPFNDLTLTDRVRFVFRHATAKIEFRVAVDDAIRHDLAYFTLHELHLTNIYNEAQLSATYTSADGTSLLWSGYDDAHMADYSCKTTEAYLLLPQTLRDDACLELRYDLAFKSGGTAYTYDDEGNLVATEDYIYHNRVASVPLNTLLLAATAEPITAWQASHHYVYTIRLSARRIDFTGEVVDWGEYVGYSVTPEAS